MAGSHCYSAAVVACESNTCISGIGDESDDHIELATLELVDRAELYAANCRPELP